MADTSVAGVSNRPSPREVWGWLARGEVGLALGIVGIVVLLILPIPPFMLDLLLTISIGSSILILMTALLIKKPLEFTAFTTVLLVATLYRLGLNLASTRLILSHGHRDHFGGLDGFVHQHRNRMREDIALFVGGDTVFREKWITEKRGEDPISWGAIDQVSLRAHRVDTVCCPKPLALDGPFTSGYIERTSFEQVTGGTLVQDDHYSEEERRGQLVRDQHEDEHATCYIVKGRGLVVISSCGHSGIINTVRSAMAAANVDRVHAVVGGFHLGMAPLPYLQSTLKELEDIDPDVIVPMHCTGTPFIEMMRERMPQKLVYSNVGSRFTFGA
jgi:metal-dependent hydrolase (beta-lactamase superfamily II)